MADFSVIQPPDWSRPRGYSNGLLTAGKGERILFIAGQIGWLDGRFTTDDFAEQFGIVRAVLPRVLSMEQVRQVIDRTPPVARKFWTACTITLTAGICPSPTERRSAVI